MKIDENYHDLSNLGSFFNSSIGHREKLEDFKKDIKEEGYKLTKQQEANIKSKMGIWKFVAAWIKIN